MMQNQQEHRAMRDQKEKEERILLIRRVSRKTTGGNVATYSVLVAVGDQKGGLGLGIASAGEVPIAIRKATKQAYKHVIRIQLKNTTIPVDLTVKYNSARILLKPAPEGTGLKVGSVIRPMMELAGIKDLSGKIFGSNNKINLAYAVYKAFRMLKVLA